jgi:hypothetical protein
MLGIEPMGFVRFALGVYILGSITMTTFYLTHLAASQVWTTAKCYALPAIQQKPGAKTFQQSPSQTEPEINI